MNVYNLITIEESTIINENLMATGYIFPVDNNGTIITDYVTKFRVKKDNQMYIFDTEQEYRDWLQQNT